MDMNEKSILNEKHKVSTARRPYYHRLCASWVYLEKSYDNDKARCPKCQQHITPEEDR